MKCSVVSLAVLLLVPAFFAPASAQQANPGLAVGAAARSFQAVDTDGKTVIFPKDYKGHLVMLDFWATWCPPCVGEVPGLVAAYAKYHGRGFELLGISLDQADSLGKLLAFEKQNGMTWRQVYDGKYWNARVARFYGIEAIPSPILVDADTGKIVAAGDELRGASLRQTLAKALAAKGL